MTQHILVPDRISTIEGFLSPEECAQIIQRGEEMGFEAASVDTRHGPVMRLDIRDNSRVTFDDTELAELLWQRLRPFIPSPLFGCEAIGLNERWRIYRYEAGEQFRMHMDGTFRRDNGELSQLTFMVYLNDELEGGETRFELSSDQELLEVAPREGMALLFVHRIRHAGVPVTRGRKYVLRSDVMYAQKP